LAIHRPVFGFAAKGWAQIAFKIDGAQGLLNLNAAKSWRRRKSRWPLPTSVDTLHLVVALKLPLYQLLVFRQDLGLTNKFNPSPNYLA